MILEFLIVLEAIGLIVAGCFIALWLIVDSRAKKRVFPSYTPVASVIVPCKETDDGFHENIRAFLAQDYPRYQATFVVASKDDPAYSALEHLTEKKPNAHLVLTNPRSGSGCSAKVASLLTGLASSADAEVLVFADSDMRPDPRWLQHLVAPLQDETIGATTGYRWYFPTNWKTLLFSVWNMISIVCNLYPSPAWVWGGSTAMRKNVFEELHIRERLRTAILDDCVVTKSVKKANYSIYFEPKCIMESPPETSIGSFVRFGARQFTWLRWYYPVLWLGAFVGFVGLPLIALGLLVFLLSGYIDDISLGGLILFEMLCGWLGIYILSKRMVYPKERYASKIGYALMTPLAFLLVAGTVIPSAVAREIRWAGRTYRKPNNQWYKEPVEDMEPAIDTVFPLH